MMADSAQLEWLIAIAHNSAEWTVPTALKFDMCGCIIGPALGISKRSRARIPVLTASPDCLAGIKWTYTSKGREEV